MIIHLNDASKYKDEVQGELVLVDFYADWCGPCQMLASELEELAKQTGIKIVKINVDELADIARSFRIMTIPTLLLYKNGEIIKRQSAYMPLAELKEFIK